MHSLPASTMYRMPFSNSTSFQVVGELEMSASLKELMHENVQICNKDILSSFDLKF